MKNLMLFVHPNKDFIREHKTSIKIEIDNNLSLGWKREDIIFATNFPFEYNGIKSIQVSDDNYDADISPCAPIVNVMVELFKRNLIERNELYWYHDTDLYQLHEITESELDLGTRDMGVVKWITGDQKISASSFFFKESAKDIFTSIKEIMYKNRVDEEVAMGMLENVNERVKKMNITYDFEVGYLNEHYPLATKPLKTAHFHYTRDHLLDSAMYGKNRLKMALMPKRLIKIFHKHGVKGIFPKPMKNLMIYTSSKEKDLVDKQIENSIKLGWKKEDIVIIKDFSHKYQGVADLISHLLNDEVVKEAELWWYHDLDVFQTKPMERAQIDLADAFAGFIDDDNGKFDLGSIFFRKESGKIFEWTTNRTSKFGGDEAAALASLAAENYRGINLKYVKIKS